MKRHPTGANHVIPVRLSHDDRQDLRRLATVGGGSVSGLVRGLVKAYLENIRWSS
jgi:hypothetical protein